jgi:hypothetical protein
MAGTGRDPTVSDRVGPEVQPQIPRLFVPGRGVAASPAGDSWCLAGYPRPAVNELKPEQIIALVAPIVVIQLGLIVAALFDLERDERRVRGGSKLVWALVIVFINVVGPILYFVAGREEA